HISYVNGSSIKYGYYIPIGPSGVFITPISSGNYEIFGRSYCAYVGNGYTISVFIGEYPQPIYLFFTWCYYVNCRSYLDSNW
ncbi:MAG: hypothetical protein ACP5NQ_00620, partial [Vulcanisaeta sp.]